MPLNVAMQQPDRDKFIDAMAWELSQHTKLKHWKIIHKASPEDCQTSSNDMDPVTQKGSCRGNPEVEGPFVCRRPLPGVW